MHSKFQDNKESDLFEQAQISDKKIRRKTRFLLSHLKENVAISYENIVFLAIAFVMSCIISFSLGVEKGRQDIGGVAQQDREGYKKDVSQIKPFESKEDLGRIDVKASIGKYIIQLAAFKKKESAQKELKRLSGMKYHARIRQSGGYYQLYIGNFEYKKKAQVALKELKDIYSDCYIKKLAR